MLRSAFELGPEQRAAIQSALDDLCGQSIPLKFEASAELVSGVELSAQGQKLAWSISDYLATLTLGLENLGPDALGQEALGQENGPEVTESN